MFWETTPPERMALLEAIGKRETAREERELRRAAFIVSALYNRTPGNKKRWAPDDFIRHPVKVVSGKELRGILLGSIQA